MGVHLYVCDSGGPMALGVDGSPPQWATCPACVKSLECDRCPGAQLQGEALGFTPGAELVYRCAHGHERRITAAVGAEPPESAQCPDCDEMLLLVNAPSV